ncbi:MAG: peptide deformylase [Clostridiales bacterium]|nr:peptide deformylase [Clostridiales bacterium]
MIKQIIHDPIFLGQKSELATKNDLQVAKDLLDTLIANKEVCVGMAANMIDIKKRIIAFDNNGEYMVMLNPEIIEKSEEYDTEEGCLSLIGGPRKVKRYKIIKVRYQDTKQKEYTKVFMGWTAQIIQHEVDHCNGILI